MTAASTDPVAAAPSAGSQWPPKRFPCAFCGQLLAGGLDRCSFCEMPQSPEFRKKASELNGEWYILEAPRRMSRGVNFAVIQRQVTNGNLKRDAIVKGPTTDGEWQLAGRAPGLAGLLGICHHCDNEITAGSPICIHCGKTMDEIVDPPAVLPADSMGEVAPIDGKVPCAFCGQILSPGTEKCGNCNSGTKAEERKRAQDLSGEWYMLARPDKLSRGVNLDVILRKIERREIRPDSIIKSPTTGGEWRFAARTPGIAVMFGQCHACGAAANPSQDRCSNCGASTINLGPARPAAPVAQAVPMPGQPMPGQPYMAQAVPMQGQPYGVPTAAPVWPGQPQQGYGQPWQGQPQQAYGQPWQGQPQGGYPQAAPVAGYAPQTGYPGGYPGAPVAQAVPMPQGQHGQAPVAQAVPMQAQPMPGQPAQAVPVARAGAQQAMPAPAGGPGPLTASIRTPSSSSVPLPGTPGPLTASIRTPSSSSVPLPGTPGPLTASIRTPSSSSVKPHSDEDTPLPSIEVLSAAAATVPSISAPLASTGPKPADPRPASGKTPTVARPAVPIVKPAAAAVVATAVVATAAAPAKAAVFTASPVMATASPVMATASPVMATASPVMATAGPVMATAAPVMATASPVTAAPATPAPGSDPNVTELSADKMAALDAGRTRKVGAIPMGGGSSAGVPMPALFGAVAASFVLALGLGYVVFGNPKPVDQPKPKPDSGQRNDDPVDPGTTYVPKGDTKSRPQTGEPFVDYGSTGTKNDPSRQQRHNEIRRLIADAGSAVNRREFLEAVNLYAQAAIIHPREFADVANSKDVQQKFVKALGDYENEIRRRLEDAKAGKAMTKTDPSPIGPDPKKIDEANKLIAKADEFAGKGDFRSAAARYLEAAVTYPDALPDPQGLRRKFTDALSKLQNALLNVDPKASADDRKNQAEALRKLAQAQYDAAENLSAIRKTYTALLSTGYYTSGDLRRLGDIQAKLEKEKSNIFDD